MGPGEHAPRETTMIDNIKITNMRGFDSKIVALSPRTFLTGWNGSGKSTVLDALELLLLGSNRYTTPSGQGALAMRRTAGKSMVIEGTVTGRDSQRWTIIYTIAEGGRGKHEVHGDGTGEVLEGGLDELWTRLGYSRDAAMISMRAQRTMDAETFPAAFSKEFPEAMSVDRLLEFLIETNRGGGKEHENYLGWFRKLAGTDPAKLTADVQWRTFGDAAYADRTASKKQITMLKELQAAFAPGAFDADGNEIDADQLPAAKEHLAELEARLRDTQRAIGDRKVLDGLVAGADGAYTPEAAARDLARIGDLRESVQAVGEEHKALEARRAEVLAKLQELDRQAARAGAEVAAINARIDLLELDKAKVGQQTTCSTCKQAVSLETKALMIEGIEAEVRRLDAERPALQKAAADTLDAQVAETQRLHGADLDLSAANATMIELAKDLQALTARREAARQVEALAAKLAGVGPLEELTQAEAGLTARVDKGRSTVANLVAKKEFMGRAVELKTLESRVKQMTDIVDTFGRSKEGPGEFQTWVVAQAGARFCERANPLLEPVGYSLSLRVVDSELCLYLTGPETSTDIHQASNGERFLAAAAVAAAFGESGGITLLDNADSLDGEFRAAMLPAIGNGHTSGQVIVAGHWANAKAPDMAIVNEHAAPYKVLWMGE